MKGFCFLGETEGAEGKRHLKIILTEPNGAGLVVVVAVTSRRPAKRQDMSCLLKEGDHPFIRHDSVIEFDEAIAMPVMDILCKLHSGELIRKEEASRALFERVLKAAKASRGMHPRIKSMLFSKL